MSRRIGSMLAKALGELQHPVHSEQPPNRADYFCVYPTLGELMTLTPFVEARLLTDPQTVPGHRVRYAAVQQLPRQYFGVRRDELVMTNGVGRGDDPAGLLRLVREVAAAHGAAIAVSAGPRGREIPARVVAEADRAGVPLFELPPRLRFGDVIEAVLGLVVERQHAAIHYSEDMHRLFMRVALEGGGLEQLCRVVEQSFTRPIQIVDGSGTVFDGGDASRARHRSADWEAAAIRVPIEADGRSLGTLVIGSAIGSLSHAEEAVVRDAATAAVLIMKMGREADSGAARDDAEPAVGADHASDTAAVHVLRRAAELGLDPNVPYAVVRVTVAARESKLDVEAIARSSVQRALDIRQIHALQAWEGSSVTLVMPLSGSSMPPAVANLLSDIVAIVRRHDPGMIVTSGVGRVIPGLADLEAGVRDASTAGTLGAIVKGPGSVTNYTDLGAYPALYQALFSDTSGAALADLEARYLGATIAYEETSGLPLTETLSVYFRNNGNVSATARQLRINRQSLLYRLERFHEISGVDLSSRLDRFALELAVECRRLRGAVGSEPDGDIAGLTASFDPPPVEHSAPPDRRMTARPRPSVAQVAR